MPTPLRLLLLYGGRSGEHEISLMSAASVLAHLDNTRYQIIPIGMDKAGRFFVNDYEELLQYPDSLPVKTEKSQELEAITAHGRLAIDADVVFPMVHGPLYEDGCLQGVLALADVAYVGCDVLSSALGMDKDISRRLAKTRGIESARYCLLSSKLTEREIALACSNAIQSFGLPLFVKPCVLGSSVGIHKVESADELLNAVKDAGRFDMEVLIEEYIQGREIELALLENPIAGQPPKVSIPGEIIVNHADGFYSYSAKYFECESTQLAVPAALSEEVQKRLQHAAQEVFMALKCKGMARADFFYNEDQDKIYFNEINSLPGFTTFSMYPKLWVASGLPYSSLLDELITLAVKNHEVRSQLITHYQ